MQITAIEGAATLPDEGTYDRVEGNRFGAPLSRKWTEAVRVLHAVPRECAGW